MTESKAGRSEHPAPSTALAHLTTTSLTPTQFSKWSSQNCSYERNRAACLQSILGKASQPPAAALPPCQPIRKQFSRSGWHRQSYPVSTWKYVQQSESMYTTCSSSPSNLTNQFASAHQNCYFCYGCHKKHAERKVTKDSPCNSNWALKRNQAWWG